MIDQEEPEPSLAYIASELIPGLENTFDLDISRFDVDEKVIIKNIKATSFR